MKRPRPREQRPERSQLKSSWLKRLFHWDRFGKDIDESARVKEMMTVVGATGLGAASPLLVQNLGLNPLYAIPAGAFSTSMTTQLIGNAAIAFYRRQQEGAPEAAAA